MLLRPARTRRLRLAPGYRLAGWLHARREQVQSWLGSAALHGALVLLLAWFRYHQVHHVAPEPLEAVLVPSDPRQLDPAMPLDARQLPAERLEFEAIPSETTEPAAEVSLLRDLPAPALPDQPPTPGETTAGPTPVRETLDMHTGTGLEGRGAEARARLVHLRGGNSASEQAVARGLRWLAAHQGPEGGWNFNHHQSPCQGQCRDPGNQASTTGATAIALLPFLGAGHTHRAGEYQETVRAGLYYLLNRMLVTPQGGDLQEGTMYAQGLAAIALAEAFSMTGDRTFEQPAQRAIDFIVFAQDKGGGGWRYFPGQMGDLSVTGWQFMALKSAQLAYLRVPPTVTRDAIRFVDSLASDDGAQYGYNTPKPEPTMTAVGLLCRMYSGWKRSEPGLARGVEYLARWGPADDNMYYNYYATQVMHHWDGPLWERWNQQMRDDLIATQVTTGHEAGSWYFAGGHAVTGGRLYNTAMCTMTLEVYYRYLPLYTPVSFGEF